jgi:ubiquinone/menaquinone biosynthesis C-methylase UbiE
LGRIKTLSPKKYFSNLESAGFRNTSFGDSAGLEKMAQLSMGFRGFRALLLGVELHIFDVLEKAGGDPISLAKRLRIRPHLLFQLLNVLSALGFLQRKGEKFMHTPFSRNWLREKGNKTMVKNLLFQAFLGQAYAGLADTYRRGHPQVSLGRLISQKKKFLSDYIHGMAEIASPSSKALAATFNLRGLRRLLDVGGGHGLFTLEMLKRNSHMSADILDLPKTLDITRTFVNRSPHRNRVSLVKGDYRFTDFGEGSYDLILFSHVMHDENPQTNIKFLKKAHKALIPGGQILIHDFFVQPKSRSSLFSLLLGFQLTSYTMAGRCYSMDEMRAWLKETGFHLLRTAIINPSLPSRTMVFHAQAIQSGPGGKENAGIGKT